MAGLLGGGGGHGEAPPQLELLHTQALAEAAQKGLPSPMWLSEQSGTHRPFPPDRRQPQVSSKALSSQVLQLELWRRQWLVLSSLSVLPRRCSGHSCGGRWSRCCCCRCAAGNAELARAGCDWSSLHA
eukprot:SAG22_NODE_301_length_12744_cov_19.648189_12_plen_128_part_00